MINSFLDALNYLYSKRGNNKNLDRIKILIDKLNIKTNYKIIAITGTNGKGSTAMYIKNILKNTFHVGLFQSPYVLFFNERITINDRFISNSEVIYYTIKLEELSNWYYNLYNDTIPFFELTFLMALMYFNDRFIDIAIFECGIGAKYDPSHILNKDLSILTNVSYDHQNKLGNTLIEILDDKLHITNNSKIFLSAVNIYNDYILEFIKNKNIEYYNIYNDVLNIKELNGVDFNFLNQHYHTNINGYMQAYNASLAIKAINLLYKDYPKELIDYGIKSLKIPCRLEVVSKKPLVIIDGAHNVCAIKNSINYIKNNNIKNLCVIYYSLIDKDYKRMLELLNDIADEFIFTQIDDERSMDINLYINNIKKPYQILDIDYIINNLCNDKSYLVIGSLHFASIFRKKYLEK